MSLRLSPAVVFALSIAALSLTACGRAGKLEAPPSAASVASQQHSTSLSEPSESLPSPIATPSKEAKRPITVPNRPFILDAIL